MAQKAMRSRKIKLPNEINNAVNDVLATTGDSFNNFATKAITEKVEDMLDLQTLEKALAASKDEPTYSFKQVMNKADLD